MRLFIAIDTPKDFKERLSRTCAELKKCQLDAKWVDAENIHLTLKFLGEIKDDQLNEIKNIVLGVCGQVNRLELNICGFGFFPNDNSPRVLFAVTDKEEILKNMSLGLEDKLKSLGFPKEGKFKPHLTIARLRSKKNIACLKEKLKNLVFEAKFFVDEITIFKSTLKPSGPVYEKILSVHLKSGE